MGTSENPAPSGADLLAAKVRVPQSVVFRSFPTETVVLNLSTGKYHGLNPTAGQMLETLTESDSVSAAAEALTTHFERERAEVESDLCSLCEALLERGLVVADAADGD